MQEIKQEDLWIYNMKKAVDLAFNSNGVIDKNKNKKDIDLAKIFLIDSTKSAPKKCWPFIKLIDLLEYTDDNSIDTLDLINKGFELDNSFWAFVYKLKVLKNKKMYSSMREFYEKEYKNYEKELLDEKKKQFLVETIASMYSKRLLVSILSFQSHENPYLAQTLSFLESISDDFNLEITLVVRNNGSDKKINLSSDKVEIISTCGSNLGFSLGHNNNFLQKESDYFMVLNDDIIIKDTKWISKAIYLLKNDEKVGIIGSAHSPKFVDHMGFGHFKSNSLKEPDYAEGSIFLVRSSAFKDVSGFDEDIEYFYFEDVDLCLKLKQKGYQIKLIEIPHDHLRETSSKQIDQNVVYSIYELNRTKFLSKWSGYLKKREFNGTVLISLNSDGFGDIVDCYYPVAELIKRQQANGNKIDIFVPHSKVNFLFESFEKVNIINQIQEDKNYDQAYEISDINFSPPIHTLDLLAAKFGLTQLGTEESHIKNYMRQKSLSIDLPEVKNYSVAHIDSQRKLFEGRQPKLIKFLPSLDVLLKKGPVVLIGQSSTSDRDEEYENFIKERGIIDVRDIVSVQDMAILISNAKRFFGIDSGPSHLSQLFNTPSFIFYGPIHPLTKVYRYENTGTFYKNDNSSGQYHRMLQPSYYYDLGRDFKCSDVDPNIMAGNLEEFIDSNHEFNWSDYFDSLRLRQREWIMLQMNNPLYQNRLLKKQKESLKGYSDSYIKGF